MVIKKDKTKPASLLASTQKGLPHPAQIALLSPTQYVISFNHPSEAPNNRSLIWGIDKFISRTIIKALDYVK